MRRPQRCIVTLAGLSSPAWRAGQRRRLGPQPTVGGGSAAAGRRWQRRPRRSPACRRLGEPPDGGGGEVAVGRAVGFSGGGAIGRLGRRGAAFGAAAARGGVDRRRSGAAVGAVAGALTSSVWTGAAAGFGAISAVAIGVSVGFTTAGWSSAAAGAVARHAARNAR